MAKIIDRILVIDRRGRQHQSWYIINTGLVMTFDVRPDSSCPTFWGMYREEDYRNKIKNNELIQCNLSEDHPDKNFTYGKKTAN